MRPPDSAMQRTRSVTAAKDRSSRFRSLFRIPGGTRSLQGPPGAGSLVDCRNALVAGHGEHRDGPGDRCGGVDGVALRGAWPHGPARDGLSGRSTGNLVTMGGSCSRRGRSRYRPSRALAGGPTGESLGEQRMPRTGSPEATGWRAGARRRITAMNGCRNLVVSRDLGVCSSGWRLAFSSLPAGAMSSV
jgi:hypothetical protein